MKQNLALIQQSWPTAFTTFCIPFLFFLLLFPSYSSAQTSTVLVGSGSTVPAPLYRRWAEEFNKHQSDVQMQYVALGTAEGIQQLSRKSSDFGAGEIPLTATERNHNNLTELPVMLIGIVPIYNLPQVHQELHFTGELLASIFLGRVRMWNSPEIKKLNPIATLPEMPIQVIYRPEGKGTNYVFTDFLAKSSTRFKSFIGTTASPDWPVGTSANTSSDMIDTVKRTTGSIGYVELQYAERNNVQIGSVANLFGRFVKASPETISAACEAVESPTWDKFSASLTNATGISSYPITGFTWLYVRTKNAETRRALAVRLLLNWIISDGQPLGRQLGYSELPAQLLDKVRAEVNSKKLF